MLQTPRWPRTAYKLLNTCHTNALVCGAWEEAEAAADSMLSASTRGAVCILLIHVPRLFSPAELLNPGPGR